MGSKFSKKGFVLASIGAAVGLGNALRFPGLCAKYGGGAFLAVYCAALLVLGIPLLNAEIALGRRVGGGAPDCMESLAKGGRSLGRAQCINSLFTAVMYAGIAGWILAEGVSLIPMCLKGGGADEASRYFFGQVLKSGGDGVISAISPLVLGCIALVWAAFYFCLKGGAESLSRAAEISVFVPVVLLFALAVRGLAYPAAKEAIRALFVPDISKLRSPEVWINALGQVFFSLSLAVGIMPAYGACLPRGHNIFPSSLAIAAADLFVSVLASVALFTALYGCGLQGGISSSGIITAFTVYPAAIINLFKNGILRALFAAAFYLSLALMAIQSGASMLEAFISPLIAGREEKRKSAVAKLCFVACAVCSVYATSAADVIVQIGDRYINFYNVAALCTVECIIIGRSPAARDLAKEINLYSKRLKMPQKLYKLSVKYLCPAVLICLVVPNFAQFFNCGAPPWAAFAFGYAPCAVLLAVAAAGLFVPRKSYAF